MAVRDDSGRPAGVMIASADTTARVRADDALRASGTRQAFLLRLADALRWLADPMDIEAEAARILGEHIGGAWAYYGSYDGDAVNRPKHMTVRRCYTTRGARNLAGTHPIASPLLLDELQSGRTVAIADVRTSPIVCDATHERYGSLGMHSILAAPIVKAGVLYACVIVADTVERTWTDLEIGLVEEVADRTWAAAERARVEAALRYREAWLAGQKEAFQLAVNGAPLEDSLGVLVRTAIEQIEPGIRCAFYFADHGRAELFHVTGMPASYADCVDGFKIGPDSVACGLAVYTGHPVVTPNVATEPSWVPWLSLAERYAFRAVWSFPIEPSPGKVIGTFAMYFKDPRDATDQDRDSALIVTRAAAIIVSRTREAEERARAEAALRETQDRLDAALSTARMAHWEWDPTSDTTVASASMTELFGMSSGDGLVSTERRFALVHSEDRERYRTLVRNAGARGEGWHTEFRIVRPRDGAIVWLEERATPTRDPATGALHATGLVWDISDRKRAEAAADLERRTRERDALRRELADSEEAERRRLARELHDQLGQQLTGVALGLEDAERLAGSNGMARDDGGAALLRRLGQLKVLARDMTMAARYLALELRPPELDDMGFEDALSTYAAEWSARFGVVAETLVVGDARRLAPSDLGSTLYRITQEALTNVAKHARATSVSVIVEMTQDEVRLIIEDDGGGFDVDATAQRARRERRLGLAGIHERAGLVGGSARVESSLGHGTSLFVTLPMEEGASSAVREFP